MTDVANAGGGETASAPLRRRPPQGPWPLLDVSQLVVGLPGGTGDQGRGHSQMRTTMDIYSHVMPALAREAPDRMGATLLTGKGRQTATRNAIGPVPSGESPGPMGGSEGTRTPDPHAA